MTHILPQAPDLVKAKNSNGSICSGIMAATVAVANFLIPGQEGSFRCQHQQQ